jgi:hypothetical protein
MVPRWGAGRYATGVNDRPEATQRAVAAYRDLADLAETIEDEWQYINDLVDAYGPGIESLAAAGPRRLSQAQADAVDEAIAEIGLITDPHKAIDWLSTFPHVIGLALGGSVDGAGPSGASGSDDPEPDDDSPFRLLLGRGR